MPEAPLLPSMAGQPISAVLLAYNEEAHLREVMEGYGMALSSLGRDYEILLVDDGSTDRTPALAEEVAAHHPRVKVLRHPEHRGQGAALRTALAVARHPLLFYTTCDRQYDPADLKRLVHEIERVHLVSGFRSWQPVPGALRWLGAVYRGLVKVLFNIPLAPLPGWLGWKGYAYRSLIRTLFGVRLADIACVYRLCRREMFARIPIQSDGWFAHTEILLKANFLSCLLGEEVPVRHTPRPDAPPPAAVWREAYGVFSRPDFGPPQLPQQPAAAAAADA